MNKQKKLNERIYKRLKLEVIQIIIIVLLVIILILAGIMAIYRDYKTICFEIAIPVFAILAYMLIYVYPKKAADRRMELSQLRALNLIKKYVCEWKFKQIHPIGNIFKWYEQALGMSWWAKLEEDGRITVIWKSTDGEIYNIRMEDNYLVFVTMYIDENFKL